MLSRLRLELIGCGVVFVLGALAVLGAMEHSIGWADDGPQAGYFPFRLGVVLLVCSVLIALQAMANRTELAGEQMLSREGARRILGFFLPLIGYVAIAQFLGLYIATALYLLLVTRWIGRHPWRTCIGVAVGVPVVSWLLFEIWFSVPLLKGPVEIWLGLA